MSSSEGEDDTVGDKGLDRALFTKLICVNQVVLEKSKIPSVISAKKRAWTTIQDEYSTATGKVVTVAQLQKLLSNMKANIKLKTDKNATGNKKIKLKDWEKQLFHVLIQQENLVFNKIPGSIGVGLGPVERTQEDGGSAEVFYAEPGPSTQDQVPKASPAATKIRQSVKQAMQYESEETKNMSTTQLQRIVLLQQKKLLDIQIQIEEKKLKEAQKNVSDVSTQTDVIEYGRSYFNL